MCITKHIYIFKRNTLEPKNIQGTIMEALQSQSENFRESTNQYNQLPKRQWYAYATIVCLIEFFQKYKSTLNSEH